MLSHSRAVELLPEVLGRPSPQDVFPWQRRFFDALVAAGSAESKTRLPAAVDLPTGLGKTSVIALWLLARAVCGQGLPTRLIYVVDRRAVVDQASHVADELAEVVKRHSDLAAALGVTGMGQLPVSTLRGAHIDNRRWLDDPSAPAIVVGTVDMIGSRLLFEGYGTSRKTRSLHAALIGVDSLLVLDEAHLSPTFEALVRAVGASIYDGTRTDIVPPRVRLLPLSATQQGTSGAFELDDDDRKNPEVNRRLSAEKWMALHDPLVDKDEKGNPHAENVAALTLERFEGGAQRVVVYLDSREQTQAVYEAFAKLAKSKEYTIDTTLLVGARRVLERNNVAGWLNEHGFHGDHEAPNPGVLFATSAGEVGVDLDAEHMVCDLVALERMVQRLGRVNRRGKHISYVDIVPMKKVEKKKAKEKEEDDEGETSTEDADLNTVVELLTSLGARADGRRNLCPQALRGLQKANPSQVAAASTPTPLHPALSRPLVEAWAMTSLAEHTARPKVDPWLRGWVDVDPQTTVVWREHLPIDVRKKTLMHKLVRGYFDAAPAELIETLETEAFNVTKWLGEIKKKVDGAPEKIAKSKRDEEKQALLLLPKADDIVAFIVDSAGDVVIKEGIAGLTVDKLAELDARDLAGKTLFVDARLGGVEEGLLNAKEGATEVDESHGRTTRFSLRTTAEKENSKEWRRVFTAPVEITDDGEIQKVLVVEQDVKRSRSNEEALSVSQEQSLTEHQSWAGEEARRIGTALGLSRDDIAMLVAAAVHHDDGKASKRWQTAFHAAPEKRPLAKVGSWIDQGILGGYRHEAGSLLGLLGAWDVYPEAKATKALTPLTPERRELAKHLVSSHHGWSRPTLPVVGIEAVPPSKLVSLQREVAERFVALQEEWGPWGLAWWESLLRAADAIASRRNETKGGDE
jgi:CRISPR-associated endonuclease/helicase Cas3